MVAVTQAYDNLTVGCPFYENDTLFLPEGAEGRCRKVVADDKPYNYAGFLKWGVPQKWMIWEYPHCRKPP